MGAFFMVLLTGHGMIDGGDDMQQLATGWSWTLGQRGQSLCTSGASTVFIAILQICFQSVAKRMLHMRTWIWNVCVCVIVRLQMHSNKICAAFFLFFSFFTSELIFFIYKTPKWRYPPGNLLWKLWAAFTSAKIYKMTGRPPAGYYVKPCVLK